MGMKKEEKMYLGWRRVSRAPIHLCGRRGPVLAFVGCRGPALAFVSCRWLVCRLLAFMGQHWLSLAVIPPFRVVLGSRHASRAPVHWPSLACVWACVGLAQMNEPIYIC